MENVFQAIGYLVFGKKWLLWNVKHGLKSALFVNEMEIDMQRNKQALARLNLKTLKQEVEDLEASPLKDAIEMLPEDKRDDKQAVAEMVTKIRLERENAIKGLLNRIKSEEQTVALADGELERIYGITYGNRMKYDFVRNYKIKPSYADRTENE